MVPRVYLRVFEVNGAPTQGFDSLVRENRERGGKQTPFKEKRLACLVALLGQVVDDLEDLLVAVSELHLVVVVSNDEGLLGLTNAETSGLILGDDDLIISTEEHELGTSDLNTSGGEVGPAGSDSGDLLLAPNQKSSKKVYPLPKKNTVKERKRKDELETSLQRA